MPPAEQSRAHARGRRESGTSCAGIARPRATHETKARRESFMVVFVLCIFELIYLFIYFEKEEERKTAGRKGWGKGDVGRQANFIAIL